MSIFDSPYLVFAIALVVQALAAYAGIGRPFFGDAALELSPPLMSASKAPSDIARPRAQSPNGWCALTEREMSDASVSHLATLEGEDPCR